MGKDVASPFKRHRASVPGLDGVTAFGGGGGSQGLGLSAAAVDGEGKMQGSGEKGGMEEDEEL